LGLTAYSPTTVINTNPSVFNFTAAGYSDTTKLSQQNFIADSSKFKATIEVTLPLWFRAGDFSLKDTIDFDFANILGGGKLTSDAIDFAMVRLTVDNGLPIDVKMQLYFVNSAYQVLDSLFTDNLPQVQSAKLGPDFKVTEATQKVNEASLDNTKVKKIKDTKWALIKASLSTTDYITKPAQKVKFYKSYKLGFKVFVKAKVKITNDNI
jgi:hypothetical protein